MRDATGADRVQRDEEDALNGTGPAEAPTRRVAVLGAAFSANKGAASMLVALIQNLPRHVGPCEFAVLTTYPRDDRSEPLPAGVEIVDAAPVKLAAMFVLAALARLTGPLGIEPRLFCRFEAMRRVAAADVVVDMAGISFAARRGIPTLGYNVIMTSMPLLLGRPVVKVAQALGPFHEPLNRLAARVVLPRLRAICARGEATERNLEELGLSNVVRAADLAFSITPTAEDEARADQLLGSFRGGIVILPSAVVHRYAGRQGRDYPGIMAAFVDAITARGDHNVVLLSHSVRTGERPGKMNDVPVCEEIFRRLSHREGCLLITDNLPPAVLRAIVASAVVAVTSRFHAMISALATRTPVLVVGWSHKYQEVLDEFDISGCSLDFSELDRNVLVERLDDVLGRRAELIEAIERHLPAVSARSLANFTALAEVLSPSS